MDITLFRSSLCAGRTCIVTGAGRGLGRAYALQLAAAGANVVVNDLPAPSGEPDPADEVVRDITEFGGRAIANHDSVVGWSSAATLVDQTVDTFGGLDAVITNAGILRDRTIANMSEEEWDSVISVHLKGTFCPIRHASAYWRAQAKSGKTVDARVITTTSASGLYANPGQSNYGAAKAGIATFTQIISQELARYGVTANAISPRALTRLTAGLADNAENRERYGPQWVASVCVWLASTESHAITGQVIEADGRAFSIPSGWRRGPEHPPTVCPEEVGAIVSKLIAQSEPRTLVSELPRLTAG